MNMTTEERMKEEMDIVSLFDQLDRACALFNILRSAHRNWMNKHGRPNQAVIQRMVSIWQNVECILHDINAKVGR